MKKSASQLNREIAQALTNSRRATYTPSLRRDAPQVLSHAKKRTPSGKTTNTPSDKIDIDRLAQLLDLPAWEKVDEQNQQHYWEMARGAEDEEAQSEAEQAAQDEVYGQWYDAVEHAASKLLGEHDLELQPVGSRADKRPHQLKIVPGTSWASSADKIRETINGDGTLHFNDLPEFLTSGPYTARQAVLSHLSWIRRYPHVYGGPGARQLYDQHW
jgi:hypothetical protein